MSSNYGTDNRTTTEVRPKASEGERSEPQRAYGLTSVVGAAPAPDPEVPAKAARRRFSAQYKLKILNQLDNCRNSNEVGALLRREGLYSSHLTKWRRLREQGALQRLEPQKRGRKEKEVNPLAKEVARLQRENERLQSRLKQAETIIEVQKKVSELLGISLQQTGGAS
jgi:transposase-like protein